MKPKLLLVTYATPMANSTASRRWKDMFKIVSQSFEVHVFTVKSGDDNQDNINLNYEQYLASIYYSDHTTMFSQTNNPQKGETRLFHRQLIRWFTKDIYTIDRTITEWFFPNKKKFLDIVDQIKPDILITSIGPFSSALFGWLAKKKYDSVYWVADFRDSISLLHQQKRPVWSVWIDQLIDRYFLKKANFILSVSQTLTTILAEFYQKQSAVIYNGFSLENRVEKSVHVMANQNQTVRLYYSGIIYNHRIDSFVYLLNGLKRIDIKYQLLIRLIGTQKEYENVTQKIAEKGLADHVKVLPPTTHEIVKQEQSKADILIVLEALDDSDLVSKGTLTSKLGEYLPEAGSIMAICRSDSDIKIILDETGRGDVVSSEEGVHYFLKHYLQFYGLKNQAISSFSREFQAQKVSEILKAELAKYL